MKFNTSHTTKICLFLSAFVWLCLSYTPLKAQFVADKIVAKVDDYIVLQSDVETSYLDLLVSGQLEGISESTAKCKVLENLIIEKMMLAKAEIDSIIVEDRQVESQLDRRMQVFVSQFGSAEKIEQQYGKTIDDLKSELRQRIRDQLTVQRMQQEITSNVPNPTPKEVKKFFNSIPKDSIPYFSAEVEVSHIVKVPDINREQKRQVKEKLEKVKQRVLGGADFAEIAKEISEDYGSAKDGGELGWVERGTMVPEFEAAVFRMKPGELSRIVESQFGLHLIKLLGRRGNEYNAAHILIRPNSAEVDVQYAQKFLDSLKNMIQHDSITFEKAAREFSDDKFSADNGGSITSQADGSTKIFLDDLDSYLYFTIDTMKIGNITPAVSYRTEDGNDAMRIIYYKSRIDPHQASLTRDYDKIYGFTLNQKRNEAVNQWFIKTKDELYIYIDRDYNQCNILGIQ